MQTRSRHLAALAFAVAVSACSEDATAPNRRSLALTPYSTAPLSLDWQSRTRTLVAAAGLTPFAASRVYAGLSVAQYRAVVAADGQQLTTKNARGFGEGGRSLYEAERGAVAGASQTVLSFLFPSAASQLAQQVIDNGNAGPGGVHPDFTRGVAIGVAVGQAMITRLQTDGFTTPWPGTVPVGPGYWVPNSLPPGGSNLVGMTPYLVDSNSQFRSQFPAPPAYLSPQFLTDLNEVLAISQTRTPAQVALSLQWATAGPGALQGYWNNLAATYVTEANFKEREATHVFALMHATQYDAINACFEAKYYYFLLRPSQANPAITLSLPLPNYPAYPSGHACVSSSAANILKYFFASHTADLTQLVAEAGESRIVSGIHYRFDITGSWALTALIADWAVHHQDRLL